MPLLPFAQEENRSKRQEGSLTAHMNGIPQQESQEGSLTAHMNGILQQPTQEGSLTAHMNGILQQPTQEGSLTAHMTGYRSTRNRTSFPKFENPDKKEYLVKTRRPTAGIRDFTTKGLEVRDSIGGGFQDGIRIRSAPAPARKSVIQAVADPRLHDARLRHSHARRLRLVSEGCLVPLAWNGGPRTVLFRSTSARRLGGEARAQSHRARRFPHPGHGRPDGRRLRPRFHR
jgi:hypothetical protein